MFRMHEHLFIYFHCICMHVLSSFTSIIFSKLSFGKIEFITWILTSIAGEKWKCVMKAGALDVQFIGIDIRFTENSGIDSGLLQLHRDVFDLTESCGWIWAAFFRLD